MARKFLKPHSLSIEPAILAFFAAFFLIRFRLREAVKTEVGIETGTVDGQEQSSRDKPIFSTGPQLTATGWSRNSGPPIRLLENCHTLCMWFAHIGFILALKGIICYIWIRLESSVAIFVSVCMGTCILASGIALLSSFI